MIETNKNKLVMIAVAGEITPGVSFGNPYFVSRDGKSKLAPMVGGITYNLRIGDSALGWEGDHVEPGVSIWVPKDEKAGLALNLFSCIGNQATVLDGRAKGAKGVVVGDHGLGRVLVDFKPETLELLAIADKIQVKGFGTGLELLRHPNIKLKAISPDALERMNLAEGEDGRLIVPVKGSIPAEMFGSGIGFVAANGDFDIQIPGKQMLKEIGLEDLRLGDVVAIQDCDSSYQNFYRSGAVSIGVIIHSDCFLAGHGPGVTTIMTSDYGHLTTVVDKSANIGSYLGLCD